MTENIPYHEADPALPRTSLDAINHLLTAYNDFNFDNVEYLDHPPSQLEFAQITSRNRPVVIRNAFNNWPARKWTVEYMKCKMGDNEVQVAMTAKGNADSVVKNDGRKYFVKPHVENLSFSNFITRVQQQSQHSLSPPLPILYGQTQNSNFNTEYTPLLSDISNDNLSFASHLPLDAINLWIGNQHSTSALHRDNYENLYCQILGTKIFTLVNPLAVYAVHEQFLPSATYNKDFAVIPDTDSDPVPFPTVDPDDDDSEMMQLAKPIHIELLPGEMLYLPALWYHKVGQRVDDVEGVCVAVNYWFDVQFDGPFFALCSYVRNMAFVVRAEEEERRNGASSTGSKDL